MTKLYAILIFFALYLWGIGAYGQTVEVSIEIVTTDILSGEHIPSGCQVFENEIAC